ncbi:MAG TPA: carboxypeptidase-like regulatory domain-containing protein [Bacteroidales bacterium]|nr:carboxypeptidase-like regulatory domain-containing protein [Bacteroidales bacterium]
MKQRNKHKKTGFPDFLRYKRGEMSNPERNSFEKQLQRDAFAEEAQEGFDLIDPADLNTDLQILKNDLNKRTSRRNFSVYFKIAASVAVLAVISSVFFILNEKNTIKPESKAVQNVPFEIATAEPVIKPESDKPVETAKATKEKQSAQAIIPDQKTVYDEAEILPDLSDTGLRPVEDNKVSSEITPPSRAEQLRRKSATAGTISGIVLSGEDNMPVAGASVTLKGSQNSVTTDSEGRFAIIAPQNDSVNLVASFIGMKTEEVEAKTDENTEIVMMPDAAALEEVVVVGYGISEKKDAEDAEDAVDYIPPVPMTGRKAFDEYIKNNIHRPDTSTAGQRVVVVTSFKVLSDGTIDSIKIIRSPDKSFSDEAIRLIKAGPSWKPALRNGEATDDEVRLRIVFR